jgi:hypothetical protein
MITSIPGTALLDLSLMGERTYLRGADIFTQVLKLISTYDSFSMILRREMIGAISIESVIKPVDKNRFSGMIHCSSDGDAYDFGLVEDASNLIMDRYPYDENQVIAGCVIDASQKAILFTYDDEMFSFMDYVVALNKALLNQCVSNQVKWAFSKLELSHYPRLGSIRLQVKNQIGFRLVKSAVYVDEVLFGYIYFSDFSGKDNM